ncbi:replication initiator [Microbispora sp. NBC_01389]|uniref:replication initiator n=1 Tax=Microbispora sp. NBC_01389 TaxID=2903584 RepID=UPI003868B2C9
MGCCGAAPPTSATRSVLGRGSASSRAAARAVRQFVPPGGPVCPVPDDDPSFVGRWGTQLDVDPIYVATGLEGIADQRVDIAKYATKGAESAGTVDRPIREVADVARLDVTEHARRMIYTCFALGNDPAYRLIPLRRWAHMLGYRGHFSTKSRHYSTTLGALRQVRADHQAERARERRGLPDPAERETVTVGEWRFAGSGYRNGEHLWAELIRQRIITARRIAREREESA